MMSKKFETGFLLKTQFQTNYFELFLHMATLDEIIMKNWKEAATNTA
jgi:hypothetical protein